MRLFLWCHREWHVASFQPEFRRNFEVLSFSLSLSLSLSSVEWPNWNEVKKNAAVNVWVCVYVVATRWAESGFVLLCRIREIWKLNKMRVWQVGSKWVKSEFPPCLLYLKIERKLPQGFKWSCWLYRYYIESFHNIISWFFPSLKLTSRNKKSKRNERKIN